MKLLQIVILFSLVSCASNYVKVDKVNYDRFEHDQKIEIGMSKSEVLKKFGSPDTAEDRNYGYAWTYYKKIFCAHESNSCLVMFDKSGEVIEYSNFRMEFNDTVATR